MRDPKSAKLNLASKIIQKVGLQLKHCKDGSHFVLIFQFPQAHIVLLLYKFPYLLVTGFMFRQQQQTFRVINARNMTTVQSFAYKFRHNNNSASEISFSNCRI